VAGTQYRFAICLTDLGAGRGRTWGTRPLPGWLRAALAAPPPARASLQAALPRQRGPAPRPWLPATQRAVSQARPARSGLLLLSLRSARTSADPADPVAGAAHCAAAPGTGRGCTAGACEALPGPGAPCSASLGAGARRSRACAGSGAAIRTGDQGSAGPVDRVCWTCTWRCCFQEQQRELNLSRSRARLLGTIGCQQVVLKREASPQPRSGAAHPGRARQSTCGTAHGSRPVGQMKAKTQAVSEVTRCGKHRRSMLTNVLLHRADVGEARPRRRSILRRRALRLTARLAQVRPCLFNTPEPGKCFGAPTCSTHAQEGAREGAQAERRSSYAESAPCTGTGW
jgi:hypothetical protein